MRLNVKYATKTAAASTRNLLIVIGSSSVAGPRRENVQITPPREHQEFRKIARQRDRVTVPMQDPEPAETKIAQGFEKQAQARHVPFECLRENLENNTELRISFNQPVHPPQHCELG